MTPIIKDDFINSSYNTLINDMIFGNNSDFAWYYLPNISGEENPEEVDGVMFSNNQSGLFHVAYSEGNVQSTMFNMLLPFIAQIEETFNKKINNLLRVRIGMNLNIGISQSHYPHTDLDIPNYTLLYYIDESDGDTIFYKREEDKLVVDFKNTHTKNQAVLFDGLTMHSSSSPVNYQKRTTININFN